MTEVLLPIEPKTRSSMRERLVDYAPLWSMLIYVLLTGTFIFCMLNKWLDHHALLILSDGSRFLLILPIIYLLWGGAGLFLYQKGSVGRSRSKKRLTGSIFSFILWVIIAGFLTLMTSTAAKPVIYLYPTAETDVTVQLDFAGEIIADYPKYDEELGGWKVRAYPDGKIINYADNQEYSYLFWEGLSPAGTRWEQTQGFVVAGSDTREFLQDKLKTLGLTPKEYNEFIVYWYPLMMNNPYNLITFVGKEYTDRAPLTVVPTPDSVLRVFMVYKPLQKKIEIKPQTLEKFERKGFTLVEWGGAEAR